MDSGNKKKNNDMEFVVKPWHIIVGTLIIVILFGGILLSLKGFNSGGSDEFSDSSDIKAVYNFKYDSNSSYNFLVGVSDSGRIIPIIEEYGDGFTDYKVYKSSLYYIDDINDVYVIDLNDEDFVPTKLFNSVQEEVYSIHISDKSICIIGSDNVEIYSLTNNTISKLDLIIEEGVYITDDGQYLFYDNDLESTIYKYDINNDKTEKVMEDALILFGMGNNLFIRDDSIEIDDEEDYEDTEDIEEVEEVYYVYDIAKSEGRRYDCDLMNAKGFGNGVITFEGMNLIKVSVDGTQEILYTFPKFEEITEIAAIEVLGNRILILGQLPELDKTESGNYDYKFFLYDVDTDKIETLKEDYSFAK